MRLQSSSNRTPFDDDEFAGHFFDSLLKSNGVPTKLTYSTFVENYILINVFGLYTDYPAFVPYSAYSASVHLTPMFNSYYQASLNPTQGFFDDNIKVSGNTVQNVVNPTLLGIIQGTITSPEWSTLIFQGAEYDPQYRLNWTWIAFDIVSCLLLIRLAVNAFTIRRRTLAPDIFGFVSSLTRNNPDLNLPNNGSTLSGFERARLLRDVRIKIANVGEENGVGRVGLRYAGHFGTEKMSKEDLEMAHLQRDRRYL